MTSRLAALALRKPLWGWILIFGLASLISFGSLPAGASIADPVTLHVQANRFAFTPALLDVNPGDQVTIEFTSTDVVHSLSIEGYDIDVTSDPGETATLSFTADRTGSFRIRCSVTCGAMHPFMLGKLRVGGSDFLLRGTGLLLLGVLSVIWWRLP